MNYELNCLEGPFTWFWPLPYCVFWAFFGLWDALFLWVGWVFRWVGPEARSAEGWGYVWLEDRVGCVVVAYGGPGFGSAARRVYVWLEDRGGCVVVAGEGRHVLSRTLGRPAAQE